MAELTTEPTTLVEHAVAAYHDKRDIVRAAGGVVYRRSMPIGVEIALIHRPAYDDWSLPKGKLREGERLETAALREVEEETGLNCIIARSLGTIEYIDRRGRDKVVWYWLMRAINGSFRGNAEVDKMRWHPFSEALAALSYEHDRELLHRAALVR